MEGPLKADDLLRFGPMSRLGRAVLILDEVDSTNALLKEHAVELPDGALAVAEFQTAGRGRLGHSWQAPPRSSILLSVLLIEPPDSPLLTRGALLGALAVCEAIERCTNCAPQVRWPNDVVYAGRKMAGVLAESTFLPDPGNHGARSRAFVLGIGLNCLQQPADFDGELVERATSLAIASQTAVDRASVAGRLVQRLDALLAACLTTPDGWTRLGSAWKTRCTDRGTTAALREGGRGYHGIVRDVTPDGDLEVQLDSGERRRFGAATTTRLW
ncbi:MAG: biotin--[acetyl-CoA-carboxylase] ligase [Planctomycetes bacterium]|nr:biotin--[acetyl-CoA-carboxylase] ligase [Planctomycetota bacterium]